MRDATIVANAEGTLTPAYHAMIAASFTLGFNRVTAANAAEVLFRIGMYRAVSCGELAYDGNGCAYWPNADDVAQYIGLRTNANTMTDAAFRRALLDDVMRDVKRETKRAIVQHVHGHTHACANNQATHYTNSCDGTVWNGRDYVPCRCECHGSNNIADNNDND